jgi:hypothetical protein
MKTCLIEGCGKPSKARGWCIGHWERWRRHGDPLSGRTEIGAPLDFARQIAFAENTDKCILWPFAMGQDGYGKVSFEGRMQNAHRVVLRLRTGENKPLQVAHGCGNRPCINPRHLRWATVSENMMDKILHGTHNRGSANPRATIDEATAIAIAQASKTLPHKEIAARFGVSKTIVTEISCGRSWSQVTGIDGRAGRGVNT